MVVSHHHLEDPGGRGIQQIRHFGEALRCEAAVLESAAMSGVDADNQSSSSSKTGSSSSAKCLR